MPVEIIKQSAFEETYFRDIYSFRYCKLVQKVMGRIQLVKKYWSEVLLLGLLWSLYGVKCETSLRFWESKGWINEIDPFGWFQWYFRYWLVRRSHDDERQINRWKGILSRFEDKLVKMIKDARCKYDDCSISPEIRQILMHWGYELTEKYFLLTWQINV